MNTSLGYLGATFCNRCSVAKPRTPGAEPAARCADCGGSVEEALRIESDKLPANVRIDWCDRRPSMDPASVATRLVLPDGSYVARASIGGPYAPRGGMLGPEAGLHRADHDAVVLIDDESTHIPRPAADMHRIALENAHNRVAAAIAEVENGPVGRVLRDAVARNIHALALAYLDQTTASARWTSLSAAILAAAGGHAVALVAHDPDRSLWAARRRDGATVALASIVDGKWDGQLLPAPRRRRRPRRTAGRTGL